MVKENMVDKASFEKQKAELEVLRRQNEELRRNQKVREIKPVKMDRFMQEFTKDQKSLFIRELKSRLLEVFSLHTPVNKLQKKAQFDTAHALLIDAAERWLQQKARHEWKLKDCTPVYRLETDTKTDTSYVDFTFTTPGVVSAIQSLNSLGEPVKEAEPVFLKVRVMRLEVI